MKDAEVSTRIALIAALAENRVIGRDNQLPWRLPDDLKHFRSVTWGKPIVMGRKTLESVGKPLPGRTNIVVTRDLDYQAPGCLVAHSPEEALRHAQGHDEVMIIGGATLYEYFLPRADRLYLTLVHVTLDGDACFPSLNWQEWEEIERHNHPADPQHAYSFSWVTLDRRRQPHE